MKKLKRIFFVAVILFPLSLLAQDTAFRNQSIQIPSTSIPLPLVAVKGGSFRMGTAKEGRQVQVSDFWMGSYEVTYDQYGVFFRDEGFEQGSKVDAVTRPTAQYIDLSWGMGKDGGFPMNSMSVDAAMMFCRWLFAKTGVFYRLPTEAEWEYACRAGATTAFPFGNDAKLLGQYAWHAGNSKGKYQKVGQKKPNAWGLYDMLGNLAEWTLDQYDPTYFTKIGENAINPLIKPASRYPRSVRGGSYMDAPTKIGPDRRGKSDPSWNQRDPQIPRSRWWLTDGMFVGFRVVRPRVQPTKEEAEKFYTLYLGN